MEKDVQADVQAVVQSYVPWVTKPDVAQVRSAFRLDAQLWGYLGDVFLTMPVSGFLAVGTWAIASKTFFLTGGVAPPAPLP